MTDIIFDREDFDFETLDEELKADEQCRKLLQQFYHWLQQQYSPEESSRLAFCADYYLRDYVIDFLRCNVLQPQPGQIRHFAASWFVTHTLEPRIADLDHHLDAIADLYRFLQVHQLIGDDDLCWILQETNNRDYYQRRLEEFVALAGDGYDAWGREEPLPHRTK